MSYPDLDAFIVDRLFDALFGPDAPGHQSPAGILPQCDLVDFTSPIAGEVSADTLMVATDLATRKDAPGIYQRAGDVWVFMGNPVMPGAWPRDYLAGDSVWDKNMKPSEFRSLYMCDPLPEDFPDVPPADLMGERACRECGCTEFNACRHPDHGNCWWVAPDLCSHCDNGWGDVS